MFLLTSHQEIILDVLKVSGYLRVSQIERLLLSTKPYVERLLKRLRYMQKVLIRHDLVSLPFLMEKPVDDDMLIAVDIMLDLGNGNLISVAPGRPPIKLYFYTESGNGVGSYCVARCATGHEHIVSRQFRGEPDENLTVIFLLDSLDQKDHIFCALSHYFVIPGDNSKHRYFNGN